MCLYVYLCVCVWACRRRHCLTRLLNSLVIYRSCGCNREAENQLIAKDNADSMEPTRYNIEFTFDSDVKCAITIYYFATEEIANKQAVYMPLQYD